MKVARQNTGANIGVQPTANSAIDQRQCPIPFFRRSAGSGIGQFFWILRKYRFRQLQALCPWHLDGAGRRVHQQIMDIDVNSEFWRSAMIVSSMPY